MKYRAAFLLTALLTLGSHAQVMIDHPLRLVGPEPVQRQLVGVPTSSVPNALLATGVEASNAHRFATAGANTVWTIAIDGLADAPQAGTQLLVQVPGGGSGPALLLVNGNGPYPVLWAPNEAVLQQAVQPGEVLSLVYDGTAFQALNGRHHQRRECPPGMVAVGDQFCVELEQRPAQLMETASLTCAALDRRLCTWAEFHASCERRTELGILAPGVDWEWTNASANNPQNARVVRYVATSSFEACFSVSTRNITGPAAPFRCCFTR